jgi:hypothetical protein
MHYFHWQFLSEPPVQMCFHWRFQFLTPTAYDSSSIKSFIGDLRMSNISQEKIARKAPDRETNKSRAPGGRLNRAAKQNSLTRASRTV